MQLDNKTLLVELEKLTIILKPWSDQLVIGGGVALIVYDLVLSKANAGAVGTTDIDFLIPRKPVQQGNASISKILSENGFEIKHKATSSPSVQPKRFPILKWVFKKPCQSPLETVSKFL